MTYRERIDCFRIPVHDNLGLQRLQPIDNSRTLMRVNPKSDTEMVTFGELMDFFLLLYVPKPCPDTHLTHSAQHNLGPGPHSIDTFPVL